MITGYKKPLNFRLWSFTVWGYPAANYSNYPTCDDNSDKTMNSTMSPNEPCEGSNYLYHGYNIKAPKNWEWFLCMNTQKCIHIDNRCDLHPHSECIYEKDGVMVAEDEEGCSDEYNRKGLVAKTANVICFSPDHNTMSPAVISNIYDSDHKM